MRRTLVMAVALVSVGCQKDSLYLGDYRALNGNCYGTAVSRQFGEREARKLHERLNSPAVQAEVQRHSCPRLQTPFAVAVELQYDGTYQERRVRSGTTPPISDGCSDLDPLGYIYYRELKALDKGTPIDYG